MKVLPFHSVREINNPAKNRVYHNDNMCPPGRDIPKSERKKGTGNYRLCKVCQQH
jgi:hypothetical protein